MKRLAFKWSWRKLCIGLALIAAVLLPVEVVVQPLTPLTPSRSATAGLLPGSSPDTSTTPAPTALP